MGALESRVPAPSELPEAARKAVLGGDVSLAAIGAKLRSGAISKVVVLAGAGISVAAGIPDFRSPGSGLYDNLAKYDLPRPEAVFDIDFFETNPKPFFDLARELYPGRFQPTRTHMLFKLLHNKGLLQRVYTQNIDTLERIAGVPEDKLVEAHGSFATATCTRCFKKHTQEFVKAAVFDGAIPQCDACRAVVKPDITFFGENLPARYQMCAPEDCRECDLLLVVGTSLKVGPVNMLPNMVGPYAPRLLINRELVGHVPIPRRRRGGAAGGDGGGARAAAASGAASDDEDGAFDESVDFADGDEAVDSDEEEDLVGYVFDSGGSFRFHMKDNYRDVFVQGDADDGVAALVREAGWADEFDALVKEMDAKLDAEYGESRRELERRAKAVERAAAAEVGGKSDGDGDDGADGDGSEGAGGGIGGASGSSSGGVGRTDAGAGRVAHPAAPSASGDLPAGGRDLDTATRATFAAAAAAADSAMGAADAGDRTKAASDVAAAAAAAAAASATPAGEGVGAPPAAPALNHDGDGGAKGEVSHAVERDEDGVFDGGMDILGDALATLDLVDTPVAGAWSGVGGDGVGAGDGDAGHSESKRAAL